MNRTKLWIGVFFTLLVIGLLPLKIWIHYSTLDTVQVQVQGKERITTGSGNSVTSKYLIFTDIETFENVDSLLALKFNSSDVYGAIKEGQTCTFQVTGFRIPFFSSYRNILEAQCS